MTITSNATLPEPSKDFAITPAVILRALKKHWLIVIVIAAAAIVGSLLYTAKQKRIYEAAATVQFDPQRLMPLGEHSSGNIGVDSFWSNQEYFATQHQVLTSRNVATIVVKKLGLERDASFLRSLPPGVKAAPLQVSVETAAEMLRGRLKVKPIQDSRLAVVRYTDADPARAQRIVNTVVDTYVDQNLDSTLDAGTKTAAWLDEQTIKLKADLETEEMALHDFKQSNNLLSVSYDDQSNMLRAEILQLNKDLTELKAAREHVAARVTALQGINVDDPTTIPTSGVLGVDVAQLRNTYLSNKQTYDQLVSQGKGDRHPDVLAAGAALANTREALSRYLQSLKDGVAAELTSADQELAGVARLFETAKKQALDLNINELRYTRLRRSKDNTEHIYGMVLERSTESGLSKAMPFNNVRVLDRSLIPQEPISPDKAANLGFGVALGLFLGLLAAIGRELMDRTVRGAEDAERELGIGVLGSLPDLMKTGTKGSYGKRRKPSPSQEFDYGSPELVVHAHPKSAVAEAARAIRTNLLFMSPDTPYRTLLVTSPGPAEGKTTVASCIAICMAQAGQRVCLIDCDLRRPRIHQVFGGGTDRGLTTVLLDPSQLDAALHQTEIENLTVLGSGPLPPNPADLMHSEAFAKQLDRLKERFDRVVIDSPPAGVVTDAVIISTRVDATIMVLRALRTRRDGARRALRALLDVGANCPGFVANATVAGDAYEYSSYYYVGYPSRTTKIPAAPAA